MNEVLVKLEELNIDELSYVFEYLVDLINARKRERDRN